MICISSAPSPGAAWGFAECHVACAMRSCGSSRARPCQRIIVDLLVCCINFVLEHVHANRLPESLPPLFSFENNEEHRNEGQNATNEGEHQEHPLIADLLAQVDHVQ